MRRQPPGNRLVSPGLSRARLPASFEGLAEQALEDDGAARSLAAALSELADAERARLFGVLAETLGERFGPLLARLVGASVNAAHALRLVATPPRSGRAFRDGERVFLVAADGAAALEVARSRVAVHDELDLEGLEAQPLEPAVDEAARLLWRHHRGTLPREARRFAGLFDPVTPNSPQPTSWRS